MPEDANDDNKMRLTCLVESQMLNAGFVTPPNRSELVKRNRTTITIKW